MGERSSKCSWVGQSNELNFKLIGDYDKLIRASCEEKPNTQTIQAIIKARIILFTLRVEFRR